MSRVLPDALPVNTGDLLCLLNECYPHRCPGRGEDAEEVQRYAGKRELVDLLLSRWGDIDDERKDNTTMNWIDGGDA